MISCYLALTLEVYFTAGKLWIRVAKYFKTAVFCSRSCHNNLDCSRSDVFKVLFFQNFLNSIVWKSRIKKVLCSWETKCNSDKLCLYQNTFFKDNKTAYELTKYFDLLFITIQEKNMRWHFHKFFLLYFTLYSVASLVKHEVFN